jgi:hypothetical protein
MDNDTGGCILLIIGLAIVLAILQVVYFAALFATANFTAAVDQTLGAWSPASPALNWAVLGGLVGALVYFAAHEAPRLNRPLARAGAMLLALALLACGASLGSARQRDASAAVVWEGDWGGEILSSRTKKKFALTVSQKSDARRRESGS